MDVTPILDSLNDAQRAAVTAGAGNRLVLAGAGSGKTRVLVHRIAWLIQVEQAPPWSLLAVTFTNKAAREMKQRIERMLDVPAGGMWVGTFHGLAHRFLRAHWQDAKLPQQFQILDSDDQMRLVRRIMKELSLDEARWPPRQAQGFINKHKDEGRRAEQIDGGGDFYQQQLIDIYRRYQAACDKAGSVDFAELLLRAFEVLRDRPDILHHYRERFRHILVDEFQDTNAIQYAWLRLLAGERDNLFLVGDDDQSIYGWRGAKVEHIQRFQREYPNTEIVRLEQNYRSTGNILGAANALIANNPTRLGKNLWTDDGAGEPIRRYAAFNEVDEARFVVERIRRYSVDEGMARLIADCADPDWSAVAALEEALIQAGLPYRVYGGQRFFERAEIKDALAYLRLLLNPSDDDAFERMMNVPTRGIGPRTVELLREQARAAGSSLADHVTLRPAEILARHAWSADQRLDLFADIKRSVDAIGDFAGARQAALFRDFCARSSEMYRTLERAFIHEATPTPLSLVLDAGLIPVARLKPYSTLWDDLGRFFPDPRLRQLFGRYATYVGSSPFRAPPTLAIVAHVELGGVWMVEGGIQRLPAACATLAAAQGVTVRYGCTVAEVEVKHGRAVGVRLADGERIAADAVLCNADSAALAAGRFGRKPRRAVPRHGVKARSLSAVTFSVNAPASGFPLVRHNVFFSSDYAAEFDAIFRRGRLPEEPTVYVCAQDRADDSAAPNGPERLLCLVNAPPRGDIQPFEPGEIEQCEENTFNLLARCGLQVDLTSARRVITTPMAFERLFPATGEALYGRTTHGGLP